MLVLSYFDHDTILDKKHTEIIVKGEMQYTNLSDRSIVL